MNSITVSAPGKLHLLGEHAVVYGKPAILAAIDKRCTIGITSRKDRLIEIVSKTVERSISLTEETLLRKTKLAQKEWLRFAKTNNSSLLKTITKETFDYPIICIGETALFYKKIFSSGFTLTINSDIPIGSGMGSSAALAVAIAGAVTLFLGEPLDKEKINAIASLAEQKKHGFPSGGDTSTSCYGGMIWYRKESDELKIIQPIPINLPKKIAKNFFTVFTGDSLESTGEMVSVVRALYYKRQKFVDTILEDQELLVRSLLLALKNGDDKQIIQIIRNGERNLEKLGVVSPSVQSLIRRIERTGGVAKICGGGGRTKGVGTLLIYHTNSILIQSLLQSSNLPYCTEVALGTEGLKLL